MPQWIRLNKLTDEGIKSLRSERLETFSAVKEGIEKEGGKLVGAWVTQGRYDLVSIIDAPNEDAMLAIDANIASLRIYHSVSMPGIPIDSFLKAFAGEHFGLFLENWLVKGRGDSMGKKH
jgi:uncharacterized protein with GYD domain